MEVELLNMESRFNPSNLVQLVEWMNDVLLFFHKNIMQVINDSNSKNKGVEVDPRAPCELAQG